MENIRWPLITAHRDILGRCSVDCPPWLQQAGVILVTTAQDNLGAGWNHHLEAAFSFQFLLLLLLDNCHPLLLTICPDCAGVPLHRLIQPRPLYLLPIVTRCVSFVPPSLLHRISPSIPQLLLTARSHQDVSVKEERIELIICLPQFTLMFTDKTKDTLPNILSHPILFALLVLTVRGPSSKKKLA